MERRGFLEKFAKAAAGVVLAPEEFIGSDGGRRKLKHHLPIVVKVKDETVLSGGELNTDTLTKMFFAGLKALYPDIGPDEFIRTLFPGMIQGAKIGIAYYESDAPSQYCLRPLNSFIESLRQFPHDEETLDEDRIIVWSGRALNSDFSSSGGSDKKNFLFKLGADYPLDEELDQLMEIGDFSIAPSPLLSRVCQFQVGFAAVQGDLEGRMICRDLFLNCYRFADETPLLDSVAEEDRMPLYETLEYPQGMKFRIYIAERLADERAIYICGDGIYLDRLFSGRMENPSKLINIVEVINPSAPLVKDVSFKRRGDDNLVTWRDQDYRGFFQIYRCSVERTHAEKKDLIAVTRNTEFTDIKAAHLEDIHYLVSREWGI